MTFLKRAAVAVLAALLAVGSSAPAFAAAGVTADINVNAHGSLTGTALGGAGTPTYPFNLSSLLQLTPGTGTGQADLMYAATRTLTASSTANIDLAGVLSDPLGNVLTFGHVKTILVVASSANVNDVLLGGAASNTFTGPFADATDIVGVKPGATFLITFPGAGWAVTATTGDLLKTANSSSGTSVVFTIFVIGTST